MSTPTRPAPLTALLSCAGPVEVGCHFESICEACTYLSPASSSAPTLKAQRDHPETARQLSRIGLSTAAILGAAQALALLAGISRKGVTMVGGMFSAGSTGRTPWRFSFLFSTPVIFAARAQGARSVGSPRKWRRRWLRAAWRRW